jgi:hypothetical protein
MNNPHSFLTGFIIAAIVSVQVWVFYVTIRKIGVFRRLFPGRSEYTITGADGEGEQSSQKILLSARSEQNGVFGRILEAINSYLRRNKGAADFHLIRDIVDRNSDTVDEEINTLIPIPLYMGLMGTMLGIILGLFFIPNISNITSSDYDVGDRIIYQNQANRSVQAHVIEVAPNNMLVVRSGDGTETQVKSAEILTGIDILLGGVKIAMISALIGLLLTVAASGIFYKGAKSETERKKMEFLEFIQQELLPVMSSGTMSIVGTLERNLNSFNEQFGRNTHEFSNSLNSFFGSVSEITRVSENFQLLMQEIQKLNLIGITKTNIDLLSRLSASAGELDKFHAYLTTLNEFTENTRELNAKIAEQVERTRSIEEITSFLRSNLQQNNTVVEYLNNGLFEIKNRENIFRTHVISVEDTISKSIEALQRLTESKMVAIRQIAIQAEPMIEQSIRDYTGNLESLKMLEPLNAGLTDLNRMAGQQNESLKQLQQTIISLIEKRDSKKPMLVEFPMGMRIMAYGLFATGTLAALVAIAFLVIKMLKI